VKSGFAHDPHSEQGQPCPRNRFGIVDYSELQRYEGPLVAKRGGELEDLGITGAFDSAHLKAIHPFREGNGRTQREFIRQLALNAGHVLSWLDSPRSR
jgi:fido (protein-threonine AMPylation protein)